MIILILLEQFGLKLKDLKTKYSLKFTIMNIVCLFNISGLFTRDYHSLFPVSVLTTRAELIPVSVA